MDVAAVARCVRKSCYVSPSFGDSDLLRRFLRSSLSERSTNSDPTSGRKCLKLRGKIHRRLSFIRPITATDKSISSPSSDCAGKSSLACALSRALHNRGNLSYILDGDNVRYGLNSDLSFGAEDRAENIRRVGEVAKLFADAGIICIASLISPYRRERTACRALLPQGDFIEVFMDVPLHVCEARDPKGLYKRARAGKIKGFTGVDDPYEPPLDCEIVIQNNRDKGVSSSSSSLTEMAEIVVSYLDKNGYLKTP
ncbi:PREDICTED: adenylyl-sulfate kinase 4, chloroplastic-like isoform X2 [Camelina sativa]|uniref:Adenylyl-sulfate kinase n=1 Tax=Camelina sativa TaxID=90675 RepID=A0ABM0XDX0_CAMSA|nr:PREDICTED: adenylyl-sulfate kinase 4, chloroplastic-like isoform X2 [Camelina sativa]